jgi:prepilin-type N-terminal cleavage/methylation domain-containing protein
MTTSVQNNRKPRRGGHPFTLIELLCTISILLILMGLVVWGARFVAHKNAMAQSNALFGRLESALTQYYQDYGYYPPQTTQAPVSLAFLMQTMAKPNTTATKITINGIANCYPPNLWYQEWDKLPTTSGYITDGFGNKVYYQCPGTVNKESYDLWSAGGDALYGLEPLDSTPPTTPDPRRAFYSATGDVGDATKVNRNISCDDVTNWKPR